MTETRVTIANGRDVFAKAVEMMSLCSVEALEAVGLPAPDVARFVPHPAKRDRTTVGPH